MELTSINVGRKETLRTARRSEVTGIFKRPVDGPLHIGLLGLEGDFIASREHHGGPDQAVYIYGGADIDWWSQELGRELPPGTFGENLTVSGMESARLSIGDRLLVGEVTLEVTAPRIPCAKLAARMGLPDFVRRYRQAGRPGLYCRVLHEGDVQVGDAVSLIPYPGEPVRLLELFNNYYDRRADEQALRRLLGAPIAIRARQDLEQRLARLLPG